MHPFSSVASESGKPERKVAGGVSLAVAVDVRRPSARATQWAAHGASTLRTLQVAFTERAK